MGGRKRRNESLPRTFSKFCAKKLITIRPRVLDAFLGDDSSRVAERMKFAVSAAWRMTELLSTQWLLLPQLRERDESWFVQ